MLLLSPQKVAELERGYNVLGLSDILTNDAPVQHYWIGGYPEGARLTVGGERAYRFYRFTTRKLAAPPAGVAWQPPADPQVNVFFEPPSNIRNERGEPLTQPPDLRGMSGCLVWAVLPQDQRDGVWEAKRELRVAGIQTSVSDPGRVVRATGALPMHRFLRGVAAGARS